LVTKEITRVPNFFAIAPAPNQITERALEEK